MIDMLTMSAIHKSGRLGRSDFAKKYWLAKLGAIAIGLLSIWAGENIRPGFFIFIVTAIPFIILAWRLVFWRLKDIAPHLDDSLIWILTIAYSVSAKALYGAPYLFIQLWPTHQVKADNGRAEKVPMQEEMATIS